MAISGVPGISEAGAGLATRSEARVVVAYRDELAAEKMSATVRRLALSASRPVVDGSLGRCLMNGETPRSALWT